jgi:hypothetical protein
MARSFNGSGDFGTIPQAVTTVYAAGNIQSVACWFKGSAIQSCVRLQGSGGWQTILAWSSGTSGGIPLCILQNDGGTGGLNWAGAGAPTSPQDGLWHHLLSAWQRNVTWTLYLDGVNVASRAAVDGPLADPSSSTRLGGYSGSEYTNGSVADVAIWQAALTATEAAALARGARPNTIRPASLTFWVPLDGYASPEPDLSKNANNVTLTGTTLAFGPPFAPFTPRWPRNIPPAAAPTFNPAWAMRKNIVIEGVAT